jgi:hypothetical protein
MFGSRQKGSVAEREVAKMIETWWRTLEPECRFVKTPLSGGWQGPDVRAGFQMSGDLMTTAKFFSLSVEVKRRENWTWERVLAGRPSPVWTWWRQAQEQALEMNKIPSLWIRKNREKDWTVMLPAKTVERWGIRLKSVWNMATLNVGISPVIVMAYDLLRIHPKTIAEGIDGSKESRRAKRTNAR